MRIKQILKKRSGLTLVEVMTAVFLLSMSLIAVLSIAQASSQKQYVNKNSVVASMLAQEGLELVRKLRDENWRNFNAVDEADTWKRGDTDNADTVDIVQDNNYIIDYEGTIDDTPDVITDAACRLYLDDTGNGTYYTHEAAGNTPTQFYRLIEVSVEPSGEIIVKATVIFAQPGGNDYEFVAETILQNWM